MELYVKISFISTFSRLFRFSVMIFSYTFVLPVPQLQRQQLMASQIRS